MARTAHLSRTAHSPDRTDFPDPTDRGLARRIAAIVAGAFLLVGAAGFVPGVTQDLGDIEFAGHESGAELLGLFQVSVLHNLVHLLFGAVGLVAARHGRSAVLYLFGGGAVYLMLTVYGVLVEQDHDANFVPVNRADDFLHLGLGVGTIGLGILALRGRRQRLPSAPPAR